MGWKRMRDHYRIEHIVQVRYGRVLIGSDYVPELIIIDADGTPREGSLGIRGHDEFERYWRDLTADPEQLRALLAAPDTFAASIPVYTYEGGTIIEKQCETPGWPNCTHDGQMMYDNTFSTDKAQVVEWARECRAMRAEYEHALALLANEYPPPNESRPTLPEVSPSPTDAKMPADAGKVSD
jgi:hypothetical protein